MLPASLEDPWFPPTALRLRLLSFPRAASDPPGRHTCRQDRVRQGFATLEEGTCGSNGEPARQMGGCSAHEEAIPIRCGQSRLETLPAATEPATAPVIPLHEESAALLKTPAQSLALEPVGRVSLEGVAVGRTGAHREQYQLRAVPGGRRHDGSSRNLILSAERCPP